jgi:hypothetical protein
MKKTDEGHNGDEEILKLLTRYTKKIELTDNRIMGYVPSIWSEAWAKVVEGQAKYTMSVEGAKANEDGWMQATDDKPTIKFTLSEPLSPLAYEFVNVSFRTDFTEVGERPKTIIFNFNEDIANEDNATANNGSESSNKETENKENEDKYEKSRLSFFAGKRNNFIPVLVNPYWVYSDKIYNIVVQPTNMKKDTRFKCSLSFEALRKQHIATF